MRSASHLISAIVVFALLLSSFASAQSQPLARTTAPAAALLQIPPLGAPPTAVAPVESFGVKGTPYLDDPSYLNFPGGIGLTPGGDLWIGEFVGKRALWFEKDGTFIKQINRPMMYLPYVLAEIQHLCDVAPASDGNVWLDFQGTIVKSDPDGMEVGRLSGGPALSYNCKGLAVDNDGNLFVSDWSTHLITVYDSTGEHIATIGDTDVDGIEISTPTDMAIIDGLLYVSEVGNDRVSILEISDLQDVSYVGEINEYPAGVDFIRFSDPHGVGVDANRIIVADTGHNLVHIFDRTSLDYISSLDSHDLTFMVDDWNRPYDIEVGADGWIYISDMNNHRVEHFDASLAWQGQFGTKGVAFKTDQQTYAFPSALAADSAGDVYIAETGANRVTKVDAQGVPLFSLGEAGIAGADNSHFNAPGGLGVDSNNNLYVADTNNHRVVVFSSSGSRLTSFGSYGDENYKFRQPTGVAAGGGRIYVVDNGNERVQVFDSNWNFDRTLGVTGVKGSDDTHFDMPVDVAVDTSGNIYITDNGNARVQKCNLTETGFTCSTLVGEAGVKGEPYTHFQNAQGITVDADGLVHIVDEGLCLVYIYDSGGNFRGALSSNFLLPLDIAVDPAGNRYVSDSMNHQVQKFSPVDLGYTQVSVDHFGDPTLQGYPLLVPYAGRLYASYQHSDGTQMWSMDTGGTWQRVNSDAVSDENLLFDSGVEFGGMLYLGSYNPVGGADIYRFDGGNWALVADNGLGEPSNHIFTSMAVFNGALYTGTHRWGTSFNSLGAQVWRSTSGNLNSWVKVLDFTQDYPANMRILALVEFNSYLYAVVNNYTSGSQVWRSLNGSDWEPVLLNGFGLGSAGNMHSAVVFNGAMYFGAGTVDLGAQVWRCQICAYGSGFEPMVEEGFVEEDKDSDGYIDNNRMLSLVSYHGYLLALTRNKANGSETWLSSDGVVWKRLKPYGLPFTSWAEGVIFNDRFYAGSDSTVVWRLNSASLPAAPARPPGAPLALAPVEANNAAPVVSGFSKYGAQDRDVHFAPGDFGTAFADADRDILMRLKITWLPEHGTLEMEGAPVAVGQVLAYDDVRRLYYQPDAGFTGQDVFYWIGCDGVAWPTEPEPVTLIIGEDTDGDSLPDSLEAGTSDGDGTPDAEQAYVASLTYTPSKALSSTAGENVAAYPLYSTSPYATLSISAAQAFANVTAMPYPDGNPPLPEQADFFPAGFFKLYIKGLEPGSAVDVELLLPGTRAPGQFLLYGAEEGDVKYHLYDFALQDGIGAEVEVLPGQMLRYTLHFVDGQKGDSDLVGNGFITAVFGVAEAAQVTYLPVVLR